MKTYLSLLVIVSISYVCGLQFEDDASVNLGQTKQSDSSGFFPANDAPDERYSEVSGIKYVDPQSYQSENRKQLNYNGNTIRVTPPGSSQVQFYQSNPYRPIMTLNSPPGVSVIRKRPANFPYQFASESPMKHFNSYPADLSNPFYQNYANHYQHPSASSSSPDYYNPTRYPSPPYTGTINGQQPLLHQPSLQYPNYYTNNYANKFAYQRPSSIYGNSVGGGISNFFNNFREQSSGPLGQIGQVGNQFTRALDDISANDELQCVPKILCQMVRGSRRPNQLPSFMNAPALSAIISALPSSSPLMNFGRAALLGLSGGGECDSAYPRCPRDEEQMLHYLNNHRGGFFRFFNGGNSFGDDSYLQQQQTQQFDGQSSGIDSNSQGLNLFTLQALAGALNQGNGINLSNLFSSPSNQRPTVQRYPQGLQADQSQSSGFFGMFKPNMLTDAVSNLLTGIVGNRFSRRLTKRSLLDESSDEGHKIQKRIVNLKANNAREQVQNFFQVSSDDQRKTTLYDVEAPFTFSNGNRINNPQQYQEVSGLKFPTQQEISLAEINHQGNSISPSEVARYLKTLFPDSAGLIRFDNDQFNRELLRSLVNDRIRILTGVQQQRPINNNYDVNRHQGYQNYNNQQQSYQKYPAQSQNYYTGSTINSNQYSKGQYQSNRDRTHIVYITNAHGQTEYELNELTGEKKRVI